LKLKHHCKQINAQLYNNSIENYTILALNNFEKKNDKNMEQKNGSILVAEQW